MNKLLTKIVGAALGLSMTVGVGVAVANNQSSGVQKAEATTVSGTFNKYSGLLTEGDYVIAHGTTKALKNESHQTRLDASGISVSNNAISNPDDSIVWHIAASGDYWTIYNSAVEKYAASTGAKNKAQLLASGTDDMSLWSCSSTAQSTSYEFVNKKNTANSVNSNLRYNSGNADSSGPFACYATSTGSALTLYKKAAASNYYTVTYSDGNGHTYQVSNIAENATHNLVAFATTGFSAPSGKAFKCWKISDTERAVGWGLTVTADTTVTAVWKDAGKVTLTYHLNGGSGTLPQGGQYDEGTNVTVGSGSGLVAPSATKYFAYWCTANDGSGYFYLPGETLEIDENTTLYAMWATFAENNLLIIEPDYLGLTSSIDEETILEGTDGVLYNMIPTTEAKPYTPSGSNNDNAYLSDKKVVFLGKNNSEFYNYVPFGKKIQSIELFSPGQAAGNFKLYYSFSESQPIVAALTTEDSYITTSANTKQTLAYDGLESGDYRFFKIQIENSAKNVQFQLKITFLDPGQQATPLDSITLSAEGSYIESGTTYVDVPVGTNKTINVAYDPSDDDTVDKVIAWSSSNTSVAQVSNLGVVAVAANATVGASVVITATPHDTNASAKTITIKVTSAVVKSVSMKNGFTNTSENRLQLTTRDGLSSWPANSLLVTYSDNTEETISWNTENVKWYYSLSDSAQNSDVEIIDLAAFRFTTNIKRMRMSYNGVLATSRVYVTVTLDSVSAYTNEFLELLSTGDDPVCQYDPNTQTVSTDLEDLKVAWAILFTDFNSNLTPEEKAEFTGGTAGDSSDFARALALYDHIITAYGSSLESEDCNNYNFMNRTPSQSSNRINNVVVSNSGTAAIIAIVSVISLSAVAGFFLLRKRKEQ